MISKDEIVIRLGKLKYYHLVEYLYECSNNRHVVVLRPNVLHPKYNERLIQDFVGMVSEVDSSLSCETVKPKPKKFRLSERK